MGTAILFVFIQTRWVQEEVESYFTHAFSSPDYVSGLTKEHKAKILGCLLTSYDPTQEAASFLKACVISLPKFVNAVTVKDYYFDVVIDIKGTESVHTSRRSVEIFNSGPQTLSVFELLNTGTPRHVFLNKDEKRVIKSINLTYEGQNIIIEGTEIPSDIIKVDNNSPEAGYDTCWYIDWSVLQKKHSWINSRMVACGGSISVSFTDVTTQKSRKFFFRLRFLTEGFRVSARLINSDGKPRLIEGGLFGNELIGKMVERHFDNDVLTLSSRRKWLIPSSGFVFFPIDLPAVWTNPLKSDGVNAEVTGETDSSSTKSADSSNATIPAAEGVVVPVANGSEPKPEGLDSTQKVSLVPSEPTTGGSYDRWRTLNFPRVKFANGFHHVSCVMEAFFA